MKMQYGTRRSVCDRDPGRLAINRQNRSGGRPESSTRRLFAKAALGPCCGTPAVSRRPFNTPDHPFGSCCVNISMTPTKGGF